MGVDGDGVSSKAAGIVELENREPGDGFLDYVEVLCAVRGLNEVARLLLRWPS